MSTHLDFDDSPRLPPHDQSYDLGIPLGAKTGFPYISSSHLDAFMGGEYVGQSTFHVPPPISFSEYPQDGGCFYREPYVPSTHITLLDARPHIQEPSPHRVNSPRLLFPPPTIWPDAEHRSQVMLDNTEQTRASYYQNIAPLQQPPAVTYTQTSWPVAEAQPPTHTQPQPSWTMSGSLDPATGVFQRAPEHPRVRTAQACEKCRVRKAKCSGEHPTCQRCRNRGLECKYAPERKMRGPNKNKKKGMSSAEVASGRRPSVFSSGSSSDERASNPKRSSPIPPSPFRTTPRQDIPSDKDSPTGNEAIKSVVHTNITFQLPSPPRLSGYASDNSPRLRKARPPPLDLSRTNVSDQSHTSVQGEPPAQPISPEVDSRAEGASGPGRRASLPSYLMESYSRIALATSSSSDSNSDPTTSQSMDSSDATETQYPHLSYPLENSPLSVYSAPRSNGSSASMSTPITPITLTGSFHGELDSTNYDLVYPTTELPTLTSQFIPPLRESTSSDMNTLDSHYSSLEHMSLVDHWVGLEDDTPTVGSKEKNLAQIESDMAVHGSQ